jgi:hypothetical protein
MYMRAAFSLLALLALWQDPPKEDPRRLLPLVAGNKWIYAEDATMRVVRKIKKKDEELFVVEFKTKTFEERFEWQTTDAGVKEYFYRIATEREITEVPAGTPIFKVVFPPEPGRKWELRLVDGKKNKILKVNEILPREEIDVPAGKFQALPVRLTTSENDTPVEELTTWYAPDVGIVQRKYADLAKKTEKLYRLSKFEVKLPPDVQAPRADPVETQKQIESSLRELFDRSAGDAEAVNVLGQLHQAFCAPDEAVRKAEIEARAQVKEGKELDPNLYSALKTWGKSTQAACSAVARHEKDPLPWEIKGMTLKYAHEHIKGLKTLNGHRRACGLAAVWWDYTLSRPATLHARYLALSGYANVHKAGDFHTEDEKSPYYTPEGKRSGGSSVVSSAGIERSVNEWIWSFYHRFGPLHPSLRRTGSGMWDEGIDLMTPSVMDINSGREGEPVQPVVLYPPPDQTGVNPKFSTMGELPRPVPGVDEKKFGQPVSAAFYSGVPTRVIEAKLLRDGKEVDSYIHLPDKPTNPELNSYRHIVCIMPKAPLSSNARYTARISVEIGKDKWSKEWSFTTR